MTILPPEARLVLWIGTLPDGAMADASSPGVLENCEWMTGLGWMQRGEPIGHIQVFHTTKAGLSAMGKAIQ